MAERKFEDLTGKMFGRLLVLSHAGKIGKYHYWNCQCCCGSNIQKVCRGSLLKNGQVQSCGCLQKERVAKCLSNMKRKYNTYDLTNDYGIGYTTKNEPFYFDKEDYEKIKDYCWCYDKKQYVISRYRENCKQLKMHRLIMNFPNNGVDHKNHIKYDNRKSNLVVCTTNDNNKNIIPRTISGVCGVYQYSKGKYSAEINCDKHKIYLGSFDNVEEAIKARQDAEIKYFGNFRYDKNANKIKM